MVVVVVVGFVLTLQEMGSSRIISRSNRINRMAVRKNWMEMGERALPKGSKPHSYGESLLISGFVGIRVLMTYRRVAVAMAMEIRSVRLIISSRGGPHAWKALILVY